VAVAVLGSIAVDPAGLVFGSLPVEDRGMEVALLDF
jgi:hypothetical protein